MERVLKQELWRFFLHLIRNQKKNLHCEKAVHCAGKCLAKAAQVQSVTWFCRDRVGL